MPKSFKPRITPYWLLGFVEGEGSFIVRKDNYKLIFTLTQSYRDLSLMESIKEFLYNLPFVDKNNMDKTNISITTFKESTVINPIVRLTIVKTDFIKFVIIPLFNSLTWRSKKELDFQDWITVWKLKERGHNHQKEGISIINLIINQMNNNRLSTNQSGSKLDRNQLYL